MSVTFHQLPEKIQKHLKSSLRSCNLPETLDLCEKVAQGWLKKQNLFEVEIAQHGMSEVERIEKEESRGAIALTYSGSLQVIGSVIEGVRKVGYCSLGMHKEIPEMMMKEGSKFARSLRLDKPIEFKVGPVKSTSSLFKMAVCSLDRTPTDQQALVDTVVARLLQQFVETNKMTVWKA